MILNEDITAQSYTRLISSNTPCVWKIIEQDQSLNSTIIMLEDTDRDNVTDNPTDFCTVSINPNNPINLVNMILYPVDTKKYKITEFCLQWNI